MKGKLGWIIGAIVVIGFALLMIDRNQKKKENDDLRDQNDDLSDENTKLQLALLEAQKYVGEISEVIESDDEIDFKVRAKLRKLVDQYESIDPLVSKELKVAINLIKAKEHSQATFSLTKIVENLLKDKYSEDQNFLSFISEKYGRRIRSPHFHHFLEYAQVSGDFEKEESHFAKGIKEFRNQVAHNLGTQKSNSLIHTAMYASLCLIFKLGGFSS